MYYRQHFADQLPIIKSENIIKHKHALQKKINKGTKKIKVIKFIC
jgi:hypothetical protein